MMATKLSDITNKMAASTMLKRRIDVRVVLIGGPGPSVLCIPLPTKKKMAISPSLIQCCSE